MKYKILTPFLAIAIFFNTNGNVQAQTFESQKRDIFLYNIVTGFLVGGVGALINIKKGQSAWKVFLKGASQGILGGLINYTSKNMVYQINKNGNIAYAWPARITQSIGTSIIENAASNRNFWDAYHFNYGPLRFEIDIRREYKPLVKIIPGAFIGMVWVSTKGKLNVKRSLQSSVPVFVSQKDPMFFGSQYRAYAMGNAAIFGQVDINDYELFAHEMGHVMQYNEFVGLNSFLDKPMEKWRNNSPFFNKLSKYVYFDFHSIVLLGTSQLLRNDSNYFQNWIEFEAEHFATKRFVPR